AVLRRPRRNPHRRGRPRALAPPHHVPRGPLGAPTNTPRPRRRRRLVPRSRSRPRALEGPRRTRRPLQTLGPLTRREYRSPRAPSSRVKDAKEFLEGRLQADTTAVAGRTRSQLPSRPCLANLAFLATGISFLNSRARPRARGRGILGAVNEVW